MEIWIKEFDSCHAAGKQALLDLLEKRKLVCKKWEGASTSSIGLVLTGSSNASEQLFLFLKTQVYQQGQRVLIIHFHDQHYTAAQFMKLFQLGAAYVYEYNQVAHCLDCIADKLERWRNINSMLQAPVIRNSIAGKSAALKQALQELIEVALYAQIPVLIYGERGTGKELMAKLVHEFDGRKNKGSFVVVDCTTLKKELAGSELFGHEKGAYTGADAAREGAFALANNGTLFLDEIGELPLNLQSELLRIIQEGTYKKTGSNIWKFTSFRLVAATNKDLEQEVVQGNFRSDLYDRISAYKCKMPCLRERREDIPHLFRFFLKQHFEQVPDVDLAVLNFLCEKEYAGNIRELKNIVSRICLRYTGSGPITLGDLIWYEPQPVVERDEPWFEKASFVAHIRQAIEEGCDLKKIEDTVKDVAMQIALQKLGKNRLVSEVLGVSDRWVQQRRKQTNNVVHS